MTQHHAEAVTFQRGEAKELPHTLSETRHLTLMLRDFDASAGSATFELDNPDAQPDGIVSELIEDNVADVEAANGLRDKLHLPEKAVPVDTSTVAQQVLHCSLHEKLELGDRVWTITAITTDGVTLTPGRDHEAHNLANELEDLEYSPEATALAERLNALDESL